MNESNDLPLCSVIIVNYNGGKLLEPCLVSLEGSNYPAEKIEIILVDNGSTDGAEINAKSCHPGMCLIRNPKNNFAAALNLGIAAAAGKYVVFANNDVFFDKDWLQQLVALLENNPQTGCAGGKLLLSDGRINSVGHRENPDFHWEDKGFGEEDRGQYDQPGEATGTCWAATMFRRECLDEMGPLDEDYIFYFEDVDGALECRQLGWKIAYTPAAKAVHAFHGSSDGHHFAEYFCERSRLIYAAKHAPQKLAGAILTSRFANPERNESLYENLPTLIQKLTRRHSRETVSETLADVCKVIIPIFGDLAVDHLLMRMQVILGCRKISIGIYDRGLQVGSGARSYGCAMAAILQDEFDVTLLSHGAMEIADLERAYGLDLSKCKTKVVSAPFFDIVGTAGDANVAPSAAPNSSGVLAMESKAYDIFVNVNQVPAARPLSPFSIYICDVPDLPSHQITSVDDYSCVMVGLENAAKMARRSWGLKPDFLLSPPVGNDARPASKENLIHAQQRFAQSVSSLIGSVAREYAHSPMPDPQEVMRKKNRPELFFSVIARRHGKTQDERIKDGEWPSRSTGEWGGLRQEFDRTPESLKQREQGLSELSDLLQKQSFEANCLREDRARIADELALERAAMDALVKSRSWRLTQPMRDAVSWLRRIRGKRPLPTAPIPLATALAELRGDESPGQAMRSRKEDWNEEGWKYLKELLEFGERISFPQFDQPVVSLIMVFFGKAHLSALALRSILLNAGVPYEIIIVDNGSQDETGSLLDRIDGAEIIRNGSNQGFGPACMQGVEKCRGEYLCLFNNDAILEEGSLEKAIRNFADSSVGAVGGKILLADGRLQEAGSIIWSDGTALGYGRGDNANLPQYQFRRPTDYCSAVFLIVRRELFARLGGFDGRFFPAYYEDTDFCLRVWAQGLRVIYEPEAVVRHYEYASSGKTEASLALMAEHQKKFVEKWSFVLNGHLPRGADNIIPARFAVRSEGLRILYLEDRVPHRELGRGYPRSNSILWELARQGHKVTFVSLLTPLGSDEYRDVPREVELFDATHELDRLLLEYLPHSNVVLVSRPHNMARFLDRMSFLERISMIGFCRDFQLIYDAEAIFAERDRLFSEIRGVRVPPSISSASAAREIALAKAAQVVTVVSEHEREVMLKAGVPKVRVLAHAIEPKPGHNTFSARCDFLFVGAMDILENPNSDSIRYFCSQVWPQIRAATGAQLVVAGCGTTEALADLRADGVKLAGLQADLTPLYDAARVFVVPTRYAAGIPHKAHEAAAHGLPMVVSALIGKQLGWVHRQDCLVAGTPSEFAGACVELYNDDGLWACLRGNSLERVRSELNRQRFADAIRGVINELREEKPSVTASTH